MNGSPPRSSGVCQAALGLVGLLIVGAPGQAVGQGPSSIVAVSTWLDSGGGSGAGYGADAGWAEVRSGTAVSGGLSVFTSPWARWEIGRLQLDHRVTPRTWLEAAIAGGRSVIAEERSGVGRLTVGAQVMFGQQRAEARVHRVGFGAVRTTTAELAAARTWSSGTEIRGLVGVGLGGEGGAYGGTQVKSKVRALELSTGLVLGRLEVADVERATTERPGSLEWYAGAFVPTDGSGQRALGLFVRRRSGHGDSRSVFTLAGRMVVR